ATLFLLIYALGRYTPFFRLFYEYLPGVNLFRRPADATYAFCALLAILSGYLLHRLLTNTLPTETRGQGIVAAGGIGAILLACIGVAAAHHHLDTAIMPILFGAILFTAAFGLVFGIARLSPQQGIWITVAVAAFMTLDLSVNNGPSRSTAKPPSDYEE